MLRRLGKDDIPDLLNLWAVSGLPHEPWRRDSPESLSKEIELNPDGFIGAFDGDLLIGALIASYDGRRGWINRLAVRPDYRRKGVAKALIREAESHLKGRGAVVVAALVHEDNTPSLSLFSSMGYEIRRDIIYVRKEVIKKKDRG